MRYRRPRRIVHQVDQTALFCSIFQPSVKAPVHLQQFAEMPLPQPSGSVPLPLPRPAPQTRLQHPPPQCLGIDGDAVLFLEMLCRQRRPESRALGSAIVLSHLLQHFLLQLLRLGPVRAPSRIAVL
jgi:hypothetical protein